MRRIVAARAVVVAVALALSGLGLVADSSAQEPPPPPSPSTTAGLFERLLPLPSSPGPAPAPPSPPPDVPPEGLAPGAQGQSVADLERTLAGLRYDPGTVDAVYDGATASAVVAFQKVTGLARTGRATPEVFQHLASAQPAAPLVAGGGATRVEIDLPRQVLLFWEGDALSRVLPVSTGSGRRFCDGGRCRMAVTPAGQFSVNRKIAGWRQSELGRLYNPLYFNQGIAIHGYTSVPPQPASHGCVRIPMHASRWLFDRVPTGTPVYVVGG